MWVYAYVANGSGANWGDDMDIAFLKPFADLMADRYGTAGNCFASAYHLAEVLQNAHKFTLVHLCHGLIWVQEGIKDQIDRRYIHAWVECANKGKDGWSVMDASDGRAWFGARQSYYNQYSIRKGRGHVIQYDMPHAVRHMLLGGSYGPWKKFGEVKPILEG